MTPPSLSTSEQVIEKNSVVSKGYNRVHRQPSVTINHRNLSPDQVRVLRLALMAVEDKFHSSRSLSPMDHDHLRIIDELKLIIFG